MQGLPENPGTFEYHFAERSLSSWKRVLEKECSKEVTQFVDVMLRCNKKHATDPAALERCILPSATKFAECTQRAYVVALVVLLVFALANPSQHSASTNRLADCDCVNMRLCDCVTVTV
jgi:hypothetical protein